MSAEEARIWAVEARQRTTRTLILWAVAVGIAVNTLLFWLVWQPDRVPPAIVRVGNLALLSPADVCPGDTLEYAFDLSANADAVVALDGAVYRVSDPAGLAAWSDTRRMVLPRGATFTVRQRWFVPTVYWDWGAGAERVWPPGEYERLIAVGTTIRNTVPEIQGFRFTVRGDCP